MLITTNSTSTCTTGTISASTNTISTSSKNTLGWGVIPEYNIIAPSTIPVKFEKVQPCFEISFIEQLVSEKVYKIYFTDKTVIKTICGPEDTFDPEYMLYLAIAKKLFSETHTFDGILIKSCELPFEKKYVKEVKKGLKMYKELRELKTKEKEFEETKKRQHEKYVRKKKEAKARKRQNQINLIAEAIRLSKKGE